MRNVRIWWCHGLAALLVFGAAAIPAQEAGEPGLTRAQGEEILKELRQIRQLLGEIQTRGGQQQPQRPSRPTTAKVSVTGSVGIGREDAPVTLVEFTDYQCPFCKRFSDSTFPRLKADYVDTGKLRYVTRDLPLKFHPQAMPAAHAARCAGDQDRFWEMREILIGNSKQLAPEAIAGYARGLGLDMEAFTECTDGKKYQKAIDKDVADARGAGITGTPSFVIGRTTGETVDGKLLIGAKPYASFEASIKSLLTGAGGAPKPADETRPEKPAPGAVGH